MVWTIEPFAAESCDTLDTVCRENTGCEGPSALIFLGGPVRARRERRNFGPGDLAGDSGLGRLSDRFTGGALLNGLQQAKTGGTFGRSVSGGFNSRVPMRDIGPVPSVSCPSGQLGNQSTSRVRPFSRGNRPVIRWIKGDGLDDLVTRSAIAQATRLFGKRVDYCLCTTGLSAARVREVLAWADQPVEWWPLEPTDNPELAAILTAAGCDPDHFGYWWKWFPERVRPGAPEWILDGDMVVVDPPAWFSAWNSGQDPPRVTQESGRDPSQMTEEERSKHYGEYGAQVGASRLYSGLVSLPPNLRYMEECLAMLRRQPLMSGHNGRENMSEQGVVAAAFGRLGAVPIPLSEFPFANSFKAVLTSGPRYPRLAIALRKIPLAHALKKLRKRAGRAGLRVPFGTSWSNGSFGRGSRKRGARPWGYHFARAFVSRNAHFERLVAEGEIYWQEDSPPPQKRFTWLRNRGQWGREGWSMHPICVDRIAALAKTHAGKAALEIGTSRGYLAAVIATCGCKLTTIDHEDRGARQNLEGLDVEVVTSGAVAFLSETHALYSLIVVDLHGNDIATWQALWPQLRPRLDRFGTMVLYNSHLWKIPEWQDQTGLLWVAHNALDGLSQQVFEEPSPGMIVCRHD